MPMYTIVTGSPIVGIKLFGFYEHHEDAVEKAAEEFPDSDYWIAEIQNI